MKITRKQFTKYSPHLDKSCNAAERLFNSSKIIPKAWKREYRFLNKRKHRFDFAWPDDLIYIEIGGSINPYVMTRHQTGSGFLKDCEKYALAAHRGWRGIQIPNALVDDGRALWFAEGFWIKTRRTNLLEFQFHDLNID